MSSGQRYTRLPVQTVSELLKVWAPSRVHSLDASGDYFTIVSAGRCADSAEPCVTPCGQWWVETETAPDDPGGKPTRTGQHMRNEDWLPVPVHGLPKKFLEQSVGDHGYWA
uniref:hypothetical protein n=1 Tax=Nonomuraea sp. CA-251285 TaxID=3240002 RepID=UPI003F496DEB